MDADTGVLVGWVGAIVGGVMGLAGSAFGTWCSVRQTHGPRERAFMVRCAIVWWLAGLLFVTLMFVLPALYRWLLWIPYAILLPLGITYGNRRQQAIREAEAADQNGRQHPPEG